MTTVHQPKNTPISFAVDYDATSAQISGGMQDYFRAAASTMNSPGAANHYDFGWKGQANIESHIVVNGERLAYLGNVEGDEWIYRYALPAGAVDANGCVTLEIEKDEGPRGSGATELWLLLR